MEAQNRRRYKFLIKRVRKTIYSEGEEESEVCDDGKERPSILMWGLFAMEEIPAGAFLMEYVGEMVTKKQGDMRGTYYDSNGLSYLFDMNEALVDEHREQTI